MRSYPGLKIALSEGGVGWIPYFLDRSDRHYTNQKWLRRDFGGKMPSDVFREHVMACYVTDPTSLKLRNDIGIDIIAWECDYSHSDSLWPDDSDTNKITWQNACRFLNWDPFAHIPREQATVGALRKQEAGVDHRASPQGMGRTVRTARLIPAFESRCHTARQSCPHSSTVLPAQLNR